MWGSKFLGTPRSMRNMLSCFLSRSTSAAVSRVISASSDSTEPMTTSASLR